MKKIVVYIKYALIFLLAIIAGFYGYRLIISGFVNSKTNRINYTITPNVEYKVYLKDNNFFDSEFLGMNKTYISSLIDYIDITYDYDVQFDKKLKGNYTYYIKGTISADKEDTDGNYWEKEFIIKDQEIVSFDDETEFDLKTNVKLDYQKYNSMLKDFKSVYGINFDGMFKVELVVTSLCTSDELSGPFVIESSPALTIPLTEQTIDLSINTNVNAESNYYEENIKLGSTHNYLKIVLGIVLEIITIGLFVVLYILIIVKRPKESLYKKTLKKILYSYDGIIVNLKSEPNFDNENVVNVEEFSELIDAHNEVRLPINFYEEEGKSIFALKGNDMVWVYTLYDADIKKIRKADKLIRKNKNFKKFDRNNINDKKQFREVRIEKIIDKEKNNNNNENISNGNDSYFDKDEKSNLELNNNEEKNIELDDTKYNDNESNLTKDNNDFKNNSDHYNSFNNQNRYNNYKYKDENLNYNESNNDKETINYNNSLNKQNNKDNSNNKRTYFNHYRKNNKNNSHFNKGNIDKKSQYKKNNY